MSKIVKKHIRLKMSDFKFTLTDDCLYVDLIHPIDKRVVKHYIFDREAYYNGYAKNWLKECAPKSVLHIYTADKEN